MGYSKKVYDAIVEGDPNKPGVLLGQLCVAADIPIQVAAMLLGASREGVYQWFLGESGVAEDRLPKLEYITRVIRKALAEGQLPAQDLETALKVVKKYKGV